MPTLDASNAAQLVSALASAKAGDTILLAGGDYGDVWLQDARFSREVTIRSADAGNPAEFNSLKIWHSSNVTVDGVLIDFRADAGTRGHHSSVELFYSQDLGFINSRLVGTARDGGSDAPDARAITIRDSGRILIENNDISRFNNGIVGVSAHEMDILSNEIHDLQTTAIRGSDFQNLTIDGNHIHSSNPKNLGGAGDHADFIHPWTDNDQKTPSRNITITDNFLDKGDGISIIGIYLDDDRNALGFENVVIEGNVIWTGNGQGIRLEHVVGGRVSNNALLQPPGDDERTPLIHVRQNSADLLIEDNVLNGVVVDSSSRVVERGSLGLQWEDRFAPDHYVNALIDPLKTLPDIDALRATPGGIVETRDAGADMMRIDRTTSGLDGYIDTERGSGFDLSDYPFDATNVWGPEGRVNMSGATVTWDFGDGSTGRGLVAEHRYAESGTYEVTADIRLADGRRLSLERTVEAESPVALKADFEGGVGGGVMNGATLKSVGSAVRSVTGPDGRAADLNGDDIVYDVGAAFFGNPEYSVTFDFKKDAGSVGAVTSLFKLAANVTFNVVEDAIFVSITTDRTTARVKAGDLGIDDTGWHAVAFTFSGETGNAILYLDGAEIGRTGGLKGHVQNGYSTQDLVIGNGFEGAVDNVTFLRGALSAADVRAGRIPDEAAPPASDGGGAPVKAPPAQTPAPAPEPAPPAPAPSRPVADADLAGIAAAIASGDLADLARDTGRALVTGNGSSADEVVLAAGGGWRAAVSNGGDDVLVGNARNNWLVGAEGADVMFGGAGADDFRFFGRDASAAGPDAILDLDFAAGDRIVLSGYDGGTFSGSGAGLNAFSGGETAIVSSTAGLERLADASSAVTLATGPDGASLEISQGRATHAILLAGREVGDPPAPVKAPPADAPSRPAVDTDLAKIASAIASGDLAGLAADTGRDLVTERGSSADDVVRAGTRDWNAAWSNGGDDVLVGNARDNWLVSDSGSNVMHGGAGADDFRFSGRHVSDGGDDAILDLDFGAGDRIVLSGYDRGTFSGSGSGINVFSGGKTAIVSSTAGLERLADASSDVTLDDGPDGLSLAIDQAGGVQDILLL